MQEEEFDVALADQGELPFRALISQLPALPPLRRRDGLPNDDGSDS